jgi:hypothetical protein
MSQKIYCYVDIASGRDPRVFPRGTSLNRRAISDHPLFSGWPHGKRQTLYMLRDDSEENPRLIRRARAVAQFMGWL